MLLKEFLQPMGMTQQQLARQIKVPFQRVNELVNRKRGVTPATALRLSRLFGNTPDFWMNLQMRWDLYRAQRKEVEILKKIQPIQNGVTLQSS
jgi:addiction module HigA family antidote